MPGGGRRMPCGVPGGRSPERCALAPGRGEAGASARASPPHSSPLLDLRAAQGGVDALVHEAPVDLVEHLVDVALLGDEEGALPEGHGLEELDGEAAGAHLGREPDPALAVVLHLLGLVHAVADAALGHEHRGLELLLEAGHAHRDVLLADGARGRALPEPGVALEALLGELAVEKLHYQLGRDGALGRVAPGARDGLRVEGLDVGVGDVVLAAAAATKARSWPRRQQAAARTATVRTPERGAIS